MCGIRPSQHASTERSGADANLRPTTAAQIQTNKTTCTSRWGTWGARKKNEHALCQALNFAAPVSAPCNRHFAMALSKELDKPQEVIAKNDFGCFKMVIQECSPLHSRHPRSAPKDHTGRQGIVPQIARPVPWRREVRPSPWAPQLDRGVAARPGVKTCLDAPSAVDEVLITPSSRRTGRGLPDISPQPPRDMVRSDPPGVVARPPGVVARPPGVVARPPDVVARGVV